MNGWPATTPVEATPYAQKKDGISTLSYPYHVINPPSHVVDPIDAIHPGITCSQAIAESIACWPHINAVQFCQQCQLAPPGSSTAIGLRRAAPMGAQDYAGPFLNNHFQIL